MPCGGIYPVEPPEDEHVAYADGNLRCWQCNKPMSRDIPASFVEEWDSFIHDHCIDAFLLTEEGRIVIDHGHDIERRPPA